MKKYVTSQNIAALTRIAVLCLLAFVSVGFSPALAAALARSVDAGVTLSAICSMTAPLRAIREWVLPFGSCARGSMDQNISLL